MLADLYASQSRARAVNTRIALATTKKLHLSVTDYYAKMCQYANELTATGAPLRDDKLIAYILAGLGEDYNSVFTVVVAKTDPVTPSDLYSQLMSFKQHTSLQAYQSSGGSSSAMAATRGRGSSGGRGYSDPDRGRGRGRGRGQSNRDSFSNNDSRTSRSSGGNTSQPQCQVCLKFGHTANKCWHRFEEDYIPEQRAAAAASSLDADHYWYTNSGATDHITGDLNRLTMHDPYTGHDQVHAANGSCMDITRIGTSIIPAPLAPSPSPMSTMFHPLIRTLFLCIASPLIMTHSLNFTPT
jgi:hypothetical protein